MIVYICDKCGKECDVKDYKLFVNNGRFPTFDWQLCDNCGNWFLSNVGEFLRSEKIGEKYK